MKNNRTPLHTRKIHLNGFLRDDDLFDIEAELIDQKHYDVPNHDRGMIKKFEPIHKMKITLTLDMMLIIKEAKAITIFSPFDVCKQANQSFQNLVGLKIKTGWKKDVDKIIGKTKGCTHIRELLIPMATTAFQTILGYKSKSSRKNSHFDKKSKTLDKKPRLLGSCYAFDPESDVVKRLWPYWYKSK